MLSKNLHQQLFPCPSRNPTPTQVMISKAHLKRNELLGKSLDKMDEIDFRLPKLVGTNIEEHFMILGKEQAEPYLSYAKQFASLESLPPLPTTWSSQSGWTKYFPDGSFKQVNEPDGYAIVFDVEVLITESKYPVMATAASSDAWFSWTSPDLFTSTETNVSGRPIQTLIPLGDEKDSTKNRIVIGHNVGYDRSCVRSEYNIQPTSTGWIDTMSLHAAVGGLCSQQRPLWMKFKKMLESGDDLDSDGTKQMYRRWFDVSSTNSLKEVAELYCNIKMNKSERDIFVKGTRKDLEDQFQSLMTYCATDVMVTHQIFKVVFNKFLQKCPHPVSFAGILSMGKGFLPVNESWPEYLRSSEEKYLELSQKIETQLADLAGSALLKAKDESWREDEWLKHLDWTSQELKMTKPKFKKNGQYAKNGEPRPVKNQTLPGKPQWYKDLWDKKLNKLKITTSKRITPYLLKLQWQGYPVYYAKTYGWTFYIPKPDTRFEAKTEPLAFSSDPSDPTYDEFASNTSYRFYRIPHKNGENENCGDPLGKSYITAMETGTLTSAYDATGDILKLNAQCTYWIGARQRILDQFVVWVNDHYEPISFDELQKNPVKKKLGVILPRIVVMGTITRRAVEPTWMTASNAKKNRIGSELKARIVAPDGYLFVGADVDSQELWISSLIGDSQFGMHGATALGWMTLQGSKAQGTDLHSRTANILGVSRDSAKVLNYSRIYGAGMKYAVQLMMQFNPHLDRFQAFEKVTELYAKTKGNNSKQFRLKWQGKDFWFGGTESYMFNGLESIARSKQPKTPVLNAGIPESLTPENAISEVNVFFDLLLFHRNFSSIIRTTFSILLPHHALIFSSLLYL